MVLVDEIEALLLDASMLDKLEVEKPRFDALEEATFTTLIAAILLLPFPVTNVRGTMAFLK